MYRKGMVGIVPMKWLFLAGVIKEDFQEEVILMLKHAVGSTWLDREWMRANPQASGIAWK